MRGIWRGLAAIALGAGSIALAGCGGPTASPIGNTRANWQDFEPAQENNDLPLEPQRPAVPFGGLLGRFSASATLRIGLIIGQSQVEFLTRGPVSIGSLGLAPNGHYVISRQNGGLALQSGGSVIGTWPGPLQITQGEPGLVVPLPRGNRYRGQFEVFAAPGSDSGVTLVNLVSTEDYLYGVVPAEVVPDWPMAALRAQAVAARTYAQANIGRHSDLGFDLYDNTNDQVYDGYGAEEPNTSGAVDNTRGEVLTSSGRPIAALFHASSGGETDDAMAVWDEDLPYIKGIKDLDLSPHAKWDFSCLAEQLERALSSLGSPVGTVQSLAVRTWTPHGRARWLTITGEQGSALVDANRLRLALGLKSTRYQVQGSRGIWHFVGGGWGHGLGMSQWGAKAWADSGLGYRTILSRYYSGVDFSIF